MFDSQIKHGSLIRKQNRNGQRTRRKTGSILYHLGSPQDRAGTLGGSKGREVKEGLCRLMAVSRKRQDGSSPRDGPHRGLTQLAWPQGGSHHHTGRWMGGGWSNKCLTPPSHSPVCWCLRPYPNPTRVGGRGSQADADQGDRTGQERAENG